MKTLFSSVLVFRMGLVIVKHKILLITSCKLLNQMMTADQDGAERKKAYIHSMAL